MSELEKASGLFAAIVAALALVTLGISVIVFVGTISIFGFSLARVGGVYILVGVFAVIMIVGIIVSMVGDMDLIGRSRRRGRGR